jgi:hypothetical protein
MILGSIIDIHFKGTISPTYENKVLALYSLDNLPFIRLKSLALLFCLRYSCLSKLKLPLLGLLITFVNNFQFNLVLF